MTKGLQNLLTPFSPRMRRVRGAHRIVPGVRTAHPTYYLIRYSALRAWAVSDSPRASTEAVLPSAEAPAAEQKMIDERFWKS
ncbi:hypothetical protein D9M73_245630 [compost metagenome]